MNNAWWKSGRQSFANELALVRIQCSSSFSLLHTTTVQQSRFNYQNPISNSQNGRRSQHATRRLRLLFRVSSIAFLSAAALLALFMTQFSNEELFPPCKLFFWRLSASFLLRFVCAMLCCWHRKEKSINWKTNIPSLFCWLCVWVVYTFCVWVAVFAGQFQEQT